MKFDPNSLFGFNPRKNDWRAVNLELEARAMFNTNLPSSPLIDSEFCEAWIKRISYGDCTYGGYMEDREFLWRGSYLKPTHSTHLGIDFNIGDSHSVYCPVAFLVRELYNDNDPKGGWGGRVLVETKRGLVIFAHIDIDVEVGEKYPPGHMLGWVSESSSNGGWFPHLHVQGVSDIKQMEHKIDGYSNFYKGIEKDWPNPLPLLTP